MRLVLASSNPGKLAELHRLLAPYPIELANASDLGLTLPAETGDTYLANATLKARTVATETGSPALGDDTGLEVDALGRRPGIASARYAQAAGGWAKANETLARSVGLVEDPSRVVTGTLRCALVLVTPGGEVHAAQGSCAVVLRWPPRGTGPGFEPILASPDGEPIVRDGVFEHRRRAFAGLVGVLEALAG